MSSLDMVQADDLFSLFNTDMTKFFDRIESTDFLMDFAKMRRDMSRKERVPIGVWNPNGAETVSFVRLSIEPTAVGIDDPFIHWATISASGKSPFFNESRWFNEGIRRALELGSKWIVVMSDDLYQIDPIDKLVDKLRGLDNKQFDTIWISPEPDYYHSYSAYIARKHPLEAWMGPSHRKLDRLYKEFDIETVIAPTHPIRKPLHYWLFNRMFPRSYVGPFLQMTSDFCILSSEWCRKQGSEVLNELFSGWEDMDLSMRLRKARRTQIGFKIGSKIGGTIRPGMNKALKELYNLTIFNELLREGKYE